MRRRPRKVQATEIAKSGAERLLDVRRTVAECVASIAIPKPVKRKRRIMSALRRRDADHANELSAVLDNSFPRSW